MNAQAGLPKQSCQHGFEQTRAEMHSGPARPGMAFESRAGLPGPGWPAGPGAGPPG